MTKKGREDDKGNNLLSVWKPPGGFPTDLRDMCRHCDINEYKFACGFSTDSMPMSHFKLFSRKLIVLFSPII